MKRQSKMHLRNKVLVLIIFNILFSKLIIGQIDSSIYFLNQVKNFAENYQSTSIIGNDTLVVSRFTLPPKVVNDYLFKCIDKKDFTAMKYCTLILHKQNREYNKVNKGDYILDNPDYANNGYLEMIRVFLNLPKDKESYLGVTYTGELCRMLYLNKDKIIDYNYIKTRESQEMRMGKHK